MLVIASERINQHVLMKIIMAKGLEIPYLPEHGHNSTADDVALALNKCPTLAIAHLPWGGFGHKPDVSFAIAHGNQAIFLKYFVEEETLRSTYTHPNDPVYNDSCVEFFIGFNDEIRYYNLEFNCAGTCLAGFGSGRERTLLSADLISRIGHHSFVKHLPLQNRVHWELTLVIPLEIFSYHELHSLVNIRSRGNFFKCGDELPEPHHLAWKNIQSPEPNFHLSEFFGDLNFVTGSC